MGFNAGGGGDPRLSEEGRAILIRITMGDLAEFADSLAAISEADPLLGGGADEDGGAENRLPSPSPEQHDSMTA